MVPKPEGGSVVDADLAEYSIDWAATEVLRNDIRSTRLRWLDEDPEIVSRRYRTGELDEMDVVRQHLGDS
jgi:N-methylhydantoinase B